MNKLKTRKNRTSSEKNWLLRQINDPYVLKAKELGYVSRSAFKLLEIHKRFNLIRNNMSIVDLGAAPGGWTQVCVELGAKSIIAVDLLPMKFSSERYQYFSGDFCNIWESILEECGEVDGVMSDMAASTTGHGRTDHLKTIALAESAFYFGLKVIKKGGWFLTKVFQGGTESDLLNAMKHNFKIVKHIKPPSSRKESSELYVIAICRTTSSEKNEEGPLRH
jgi:23S rRNA (uridine2552-2'-O)-methyltransferase